MWKALTSVNTCYFRLKICTYRDDQCTRRYGSTEDSTRLIVFKSKETDNDEHIQSHHPIEDYKQNFSGLKHSFVGYFHNWNFVRKLQEAVRVFVRKGRLNITPGCMRQRHCPKNSLLTIPELSIVL